MDCFRCKNKTLKPDRQEGDCNFYECKSCGRKYCQQKGLGLCDAWPCPLGLVLYGMIFENDPVSKATTHADYFLKDHDATTIKSICEDIELELAAPSQKVRDIVNCLASEETLREFLSIVAQRLRTSFQSC